MSVIEAESADSYFGVAIGGGGVSNVDNGDWLRYVQTDFGSGVSSFDAWVAVDPQYAGQKIEIRLDSTTGPKIGELTVQSTGGWSTFAQQSVQLAQAVSGVRDLYLVALGSYGIANIDKFQFKASTRDALAVIEAETANSSSGVSLAGGGVSQVDNGDWVGYASLNFGSGATGFDAWVAVDPSYAGQKLELRLDGVTGTKVGELTVQSTGGWSTFTRQSTTLTQAVTGVHSLYLVAQGTYGIANIDKFQFTSISPGTRSAFTDIEGESFNSSRNAFVEGNHVGSFDNGNWAGYNQIDFGSGAASVRMLVAVDPAYANQRFDIRLGSATGTKVGELTVASTGGWNTYQWQTAPLNQTVTGLKDVYLVAVGTYGAGNIDKFRFVAGTVTTPPGGTRTDSPPLSYSGQTIVTIKDKRITGASGNCITVSGATTRVEIDNVELSGCGGHGIAVSNSANVVIRNSVISSLTHAVNTPSDGIFASNVTGLIVEDSQFSDIYTTGSGNTDLYAVAIRTSQTTGVTVQRNNFVRVGSGLVAWNTSQTVDFSHNTGTTMMGPYPRGQLVQFAGVRGSGNKISCNKVDNTDPANRTEDNINVFDTQGTAASPVLVEYNRIKGGASPTGSGIVVGDNGGSYIRVIGNVVVNPSNAGIGTWGGSNIVVENNRIYKNWPGNSGEGLNTGGSCPGPITYNNNLIRWNEADDPTKGPYNLPTCRGNVNCSEYWSIAMNIRSSCPTANGVTNENWGTNNVNATFLSPTMFDEAIPQCN